MIQIARPVVFWTGGLPISTAIIVINLGVEIQRNEMAVVSSLAGILFGTMRAARAAKLDSVDSLQHE
jgi:hypothetical protein